MWSSASPVAASVKPHLTRLGMIPTGGGMVRHGLRCDDADFAGFGEAYFSLVEAGQLRGWKKHLRMTLNLIVVTGAMRFIVESDDASERFMFDLSPAEATSYGRLTVPPGWWVAFGALNEDAMLLNLASIPHDPRESELKPIDVAVWSWD